VGLLKSFYLVLVLVLSLFFVSKSYSNDIDAGNERFHKNCHNCHGRAGMGVASYPKVSGLDSSYIVDRLNRLDQVKKLAPIQAL